MKHKAIGISLAGTLLLCAQPAFAGWQATRWNMTPDQLAAAMGGSAPISRGSSGDRLGEKRVGNVGQYRLGNARFRTVYYYDANGLAQIALKRTGGDCREVYAGLVRDHGQPIVTSDQVVLRLFIWHDRPAENRIRLLVSTSVCDLNYERLTDYEAIDLSRSRR